jgi:hypothetical protein
MALWWSLTFLCDSRCHGGSAIGGGERYDIDCRAVEKIRTEQWTLAVKHLTVRDPWPYKTTKTSPTSTIAFIGLQSSLLLVNLLHYNRVGFLTKLVTKSKHHLLL